mgnify:FL=1
MKRRLFTALACVLLCLAVLPGTASADTGPKPAVTITVVNAPAGEYYLDLLITDPEPDHDNIEVADYDPELIAGLKSWEDEGWYPALVTGTRAPLFGELTAEADGIHRFSYNGLPRTFRIAVSGPGGAQATAEPFTRTVFYTHLTYDWETNTITSATSPAGFYGLQFLSTLVPTLIIEGILLWLFGFRAKRDWLVFLVVNLVTQAGLHLWIGSGAMAAGSHPLYYLVLIVAEVPILLVELVVYVFLLQEHSRLRRAAYAACANVASYALGYFPLHWAVEFLSR